jgi:hypothetical protein
MLMNARSNSTLEENQIQYWICMFLLLEMNTYVANAKKVQRTDARSLTRLGRLGATVNLLVILIVGTGVDPTIGVKVTAADGAEDGGWQGTSSSAIPTSS